MLYGALAQSVEHLTFNQVVRGSNPRCFRKEKAGNLELIRFSVFLRLKILFWYVHGTLIVVLLNNYFQALISDGVSERGSGDFGIYRESIC